MEYNGGMRYSKEQIREVSEALQRESDLAQYKRLQILLYRIQGTRMREVVELTQASESTVRRICAQYRKQGLRGLENKYKSDNRRRRKIPLEAEAAILRELSEKAASGQYTRVAEIQVEFEKAAGVKYEFSGFVRLLERHNWRKAVPRGRHPKAADEAACEAAKKLTI